ncbi:hypothetical protein WS69_23345 [Burkholderia sp. BDU5]|nr:hypothetical protein WS69_23345 [Burkholderia sp. BDU5]
MRDGRAARAWGRSRSKRARVPFGLAASASGAGFRRDPRGYARFRRARRGAERRTGEPKLQASPSRACLAFDATHDGFSDPWRLA